MSPGPGTILLMTPHGGVLFPSSWAVPVSSTRLCKLFLSRENGEVVRWCKCSLVGLSNFTVSVSCISNEYIERFGTGSGVCSAVVSIHPAWASLRFHSQYQKEREKRQSKFNLISLYTELFRVILYIKFQIYIPVHKLQQPVLV